MLLYPWIVVRVGEGASGETRPALDAYPPVMALASPMTDCTLDNDRWSFIMESTILERTNSPKTWLRATLPQYHPSLEPEHIYARL